MPGPFQYKLPPLASGAAFAPQRQFMNGAPVHNWYDDVLADQAGYRGGNIPQGIAGTATNWTWQNPDPKLANRTAGGGVGAPGMPIDGPGGSNLPGTAPAITPNRWFAQPWQTQAKADVPYWQRGMPNYRG